MKMRQLYYTTLTFISNYVIELIFITIIVTGVNQLVQQITNVYPVKIDSFNNAFKLFIVCTGAMIVMILFDVLFNPLFHKAAMYHLTTIAFILLRLLGGMTLYLTLLCLLNSVKLDYQNNYAIFGLLCMLILSNYNYRFNIINIEENKPKSKEEVL